MESSVQHVQVLSGFETNGLSGGDRHLVAGAGIAADPGFARLDGEDTEAAQFDPVTFDEALLHGVEDGVYGGLGFCAHKPCAIDNPLDEILFDHFASNDGPTERK